VIAVVEFSKSSDLYNKITLSPPVMMLISFLILIILGTIFLAMPRMSHGHISFIDALFTATSAGSVTGLSVLNIGQTFTLKGQIVILFLIQMGGLSILTFATFLTAFFSKSNTGLKYQNFVKNLIYSNRLSDSFILLKEIVAMAFFIEAIGTLMLFVYWKNVGVFSETGETFLYAIFHAISAFNNAGFSLWDSNFMNNAVVHSYFPQAVMMLMVLLGGLGFLTINDIWNPRHRKERRKYPWKKLMPGTRIVLWTTFYVILIGTMIFFFVEYDHSLKYGISFFDKVYNAVFQVVVSRTSGFNTINVSHISISGMLLLIMLMFIGASPGSTGGGIKNTTLFVIIKSVIATIRGKKYIEFEKKTIPFELVDKSYSIVVMSLILIFISTFILSLLEPAQNLTTLMFESVSAFSTAGLSTGAPVTFSIAGKLVLILNMYIGRIGTLTLAFALSKRIKESRHQYPETYFMVG
jgi:potassium uptake TrkH family protein